MFWKEKDQENINQIVSETVEATGILRASVYIQVSAVNFVVSISIGWWKD
jgi:hypothetical protein